MKVETLVVIVSLPLGPLEALPGISFGVRIPVVGVPVQAEQLLLVIFDGRTRVGLWLVLAQVRFLRFGCFGFGFFFAFLTFLRSKEIFLFIFCRSRRS